MKVEELKNYGRPYSETMVRLPQPVQRRIKKESFRVVRQHLGFLGNLRLMILARREKKRLQGVDLTSVREKGLTSELFIEQTIHNTALFSAMARITGTEGAVAIYYQIMDKVSILMNEAILPSTDQLRGMENDFKAFRDYLMAFFAAEKEAGLHDYEVAEESDRAIALNVTYCAFFEIPRLCGIVEACDPSCYSDEVFFPGYLEPLGVRFVRTKTLARGGDFCDFRFEKEQSKA
jgi:hypothetical protein